MAVTKTAERIPLTESRWLVEIGNGVTHTPIPSEPEVRTHTSVGASRDCCVKAEGLIDPVEWRLMSRNLSGTADVIVHTRLNE